MPNYAFICEKCEHEFEKFLSIADREEPLSKSCPNCKKRKCVKRNFNDYSQTIGSDHTLDANKATGGRWNELMGRMKKGLSKRFHKNLDVASSQKGKYWSG